MNNRVDIFVENYRLDVDDIELAITYSFQDLTNPQAITGDYSKTIKLKGTQTNNAAFGQIWNLDRTTIVSSLTQNVGINFNASKRASCKIFINDALFKSGYLKLNSVIINNGVIEYEVTFYSTLCDLLHTLSEKKLVDLSYPNNLKHQVSRTSIKYFWNGLHQLNPYMTYVMANNGLYDSFDSDRQLTKDTSGNYIVSELGLNLDECAKGEYRSQYQRPALTIKGIIDKIVEDNNASNNLKLKLDNAFFNNANPYYASSVLTMPQYNLEDNYVEYIGTYNDNYGTIDVCIGNSSPYPSGYGLLKYNDTNDSSIFNGTNRIDLSGLQGDTQIKIEFEVGIKFNIDSIYHGLAQVGDILTPSTNKPLCYIEAYLLENGVIKEQLQPYTNYDNEIYMTKAKVISDSHAQVYFSNPYTNYQPNGSDEIAWFPVHFYSTRATNTYSNYQIQVKISQYTNMFLKIGNGGMQVYCSTISATLRPIQKLPSQTTSFNANYYYPANGINFENVFYGKDIIIDNNQKITSGSNVSKDDIIDSEITQGDFLINYAKLFGLIFDTDVSGNITLTTRNKYFSDYQILDWSNKIDYSNSITQTPITFSDKYIQFNYQASDTHYETYYKDKYGVDYGAQKLNTGYEFNSTTKELTDNNLFNNTIMSKEKTRMLIGGNYVYAIDSKILPALFTLDNNERNPSESKYNLLFDNGKKLLPNTIALTDNMNEMFNEEIGGGESCWIDTNKLTQNIDFLDFYNEFSTLTNDGKLSWNIGYPRENYASWTPNDYQASATIYSNFWESYIQEIYNVDNKIVKCKVRLTPNDINTFKFSNFISAFGCLWLVNKINNYNPLNDGLTEVELLKVSSLDSYVSGQKKIYREYSVQYDLMYANSSNTATKIIDGETFTTQLTPIDGYKIENVYVTMDSQDITPSSYDATTHTITVTNVSGNLHIMCGATQLEIETTTSESQPLSGRMAIVDEDESLPNDLDTVINDYIEQI